MATNKIIRKIISSSMAPKPVGPYNQAVVVNQTAYLSGVIGVDRSTGKLVGTDITNETRQVLVNMQNVLNEAGSSMSKVVKTTIFLTNMDDFSTVNEVYKQFFTENYPARSTIQVSKLPLGAKIEIEAVAVVGEVETVS